MNTFKRKDLSSVGRDSCVNGSAEAVYLNPNGTGQVLGVIPSTVKTVCAADRFSLGSGRRHKRDGFKGLWLDWGQTLQESAHPAPLKVLEQTLLGSDSSSSRR